MKAALALLGLLFRNGWMKFCNN